MKHIKRMMPRTMRPTSGALARANGKGKSNQSYRPGTPESLEKDPPLTHVDQRLVLFVHVVILGPSQLMPLSSSTMYQRGAQQYQWCTTPHLHSQRCYTQLRPGSHRQPGSDYPVSSSALQAAPRPTLIFLRTVSERQARGPDSQSLRRPLL